MTAGTRARVDARLVPAALAAWVSTAVALGQPPRAAVAAAVALLAAAAVALRFRRWLAATALVAAAAGAGGTAARVATWTGGPVAAVAASHRTATVVARVTGDPRMVLTRHGRRLVVVDLRILGFAAVQRPERPDTDGGAAGSGRAAAGLAVPAPAVLFAVGPGWAGILPGQRIVVTARFRPPRRADHVAATLFAAAPPHLVGRPPWWQRAAGHARAALAAACAQLPADARGLVPGLVVGDVSAMPADLTEAFRVTGLTHLNAVSGENVAIVVGAVTLLARRAGSGRRLTAAVALLALGGFVVLARPSPSVLRAAVMGGIGLVGVLTGRRAQALPLLSAAVLALVLADPPLAAAPGFALSVLATAALVVLAPRWTDTLSRRWPRPLAAAVAVPAAAQLACTPVLVGVFGQLTPWAVPANLLAAPAVAPVTLVGIATAATALVLPGLAPLVAWVAALPALWLAGVARTLARFPGAGMGWPRGLPGVLLLGLVLAAALAAHAARRRRRAILGACPR